MDNAHLDIFLHGHGPKRGDSAIVKEFLVNGWQRKENKIEDFEAHIGDPVSSHLL